METRKVTTSLANILYRFAIEEIGISDEAGHAVIETPDTRYEVTTDGDTILVTANGEQLDF